MPQEPFQESTTRAQREAHREWLRMTPRLTAEEWTVLKWLSGRTKEHFAKTINRLHNFGLIHKEDIINAPSPLTLKGISYLEYRLVLEQQFKQKAGI